MTSRIFLLSGYIVAFLLMLACASDDEAQRRDNPAVAFAASVDRSDSAATRAPHAIGMIDALKTEGGFGVYGCYTSLHRYKDTDVNPDFMYNEHVSWDEATESWTYAPLKYWPNGEGETYPSIVTGENPHYVSFMAYAPYRASADLCLYDFSRQSDFGDPWIDYRLHPDVTRQVDLLYAIPLLDEKKPGINERLLFRFRHALGCVGDQVTFSCGSELLTKLHETAFLSNVQLQLLRVTIEYTLTEEGRLTLWNKTEDPNWQLIPDDTPTTVRTVTLTANMPATLYRRTKSGGETAISWTDSGHGVFFIPRQYADHLQTAKVTVDYSISVDGLSEVITSSKTFKLNDYPKGYQHGKHLYINAVIGLNEGGDPVLEGVLIDDVQMAVNEWTPAPDVEHEVYNW